MRMEVKILYVACAVSCCVHDTIVLLSECRGKLIAYEHLLLSSSVVMKKKKKKKRNCNATIHDILSEQHSVKLYVTRNFDDSCSIQ
jgi:hypothetical protein